MNAPAHCYPVIKVIDPLSNPSDPRAVDYGIHVAFAASGAILGQMPGLMKIQRAQEFADMEETIRREMEDEKHAAHRKRMEAVEAQLAEARIVGAELVAMQAAKRRAERKAKIIEAIRAGHNTATKLRAATKIPDNGESGILALMAEMMAAGVVRYWKERNPKGIGGCHNVYEVAL